MVGGDRRDITDSARGKWAVQVRRDVTDRARGKVVVRERLNVTDCKGVSVRERRKFTDSARGEESLGRNVMIQTVQR